MKQKPEISNFRSYVAYVLSRIEIQNIVFNGHRYIGNGSTQIRLENVDKIYAQLHINTSSMQITSICIEFVLLF